eukprot:COSAG02_NODE_2472_length_8743_cov_66.542573_4_plen_144_part_00
MILERTVFVVVERERRILLTQQVPEPEALVCEKQHLRNELTHNNVPTVLGVGTCPLAQSGHRAASLRPRSPAQQSCARIRELLCEPQRLSSTDLHRHLAAIEQINGFEVNACPSGIHSQHLEMAGELQPCANGLTEACRISPW